MIFVKPHSGSEYSISNLHYFIDKSVILRLLECQVGAEAHAVLQPKITTFCPNIQAV